MRRLTILLLFGFALSCDGKSSTSTDGSCDGKPDSADSVRYQSSHYADYYNTDYVELYVPWDKSLNDDNLRIQVTSTYNTHGDNRYHITYNGYVTAN